MGTLRFFFTELDPRAEIKGSRDPLGWQGVWSAFGRRVVGNLTTVTGQVESFTTLLLGLYFGEMAQGGRDPGDGDRTSDLFIRFELLAAYSRAARSPKPAALGIRGIWRVRQRLPSKSFLIGSGPDEQILGNQKTYGIWGLYRMAGVASGLLEESGDRLTADARDFVERVLLPTMGGGRDAIVGFLRAEQPRSFEPGGRHADLAKGLDRVHGDLTPAARDFYRHSLVLGQKVDRTNGRQAELWAGLVAERRRADVGWDRPMSLAELAMVAQDTHSDDLRDALLHIVTLDPALAVTDAVFDFLLRHPDFRLEDVAKELKLAWPRGVPNVSGADLAALPATLEQSAGSDGRGRLIETASALHRGAYEEAFALLLQQNRAVASGRGGGPWATLESGRLHVHFRSDEPLGVPPEDRLPVFQRYTYFIDSLAGVGASVDGLA